VLPLFACWLVVAGAPVHADGRAEVRDVLLLLDDGPRHIRLHVTLMGRPLTEVQDEYIDRLMAALDTDGDGRLTRREAARSPLRSGPAQKRNNAFLDSLDGDRPVTRGDIARDVARAVSDTVIYRQDEAAARSDTEIFGVLDEDSSGVVDREEMATAFLRILERDADRDRCVTFDEFPVPPDQAAAPLVVGLPQPDPNAPRPGISELLRDLRQPTLPLRVLRQYDRNRDKRLSAAELHWDAAQLAIFDADGDGRLVQTELTGLDRLPVDAELAVELDGASAVEKLRVLAAAGGELQPAPRPDLVRLKLGEVQFTFSWRDADPVAAAVGNALQQFNLLDVDANGYLERAEVAARFRFERGLFETIDRDGDEKIFGDEMRAYVAARAEPAAACCQVNVYHTGHGYFQLLDANGDGRISVRELRHTEQYLVLAAAARGGSLAPDATGRH
jgi:Ca2+-binding EF-hand superfamily protein